jgi:regulator of protease activity HflC (stomatin/prohibitin superfamily)
VRYTIDRPRVYLFDCADPEALVRSAAEGVLRERVAALSFAEILTTDRGALQAVVMKELSDRCAAYGPEGLGIHLEGLALHDLHPPQEVVRAYHEVTNAMENRDRRVNQAEADALSMVRAQEGQNLQIVRRAEAAREETMRMAEARLAAFTDRYQQRSRLSLTEEWQLFRDAWREVERGVPVEQAGREYQRRRAEAVAVQEALTDLRLYWDMLAGALAGRDKVLIDSDKVPGRRSLWMLPLESFREMVPGAMPERSPRPGPREER